MRLTVQGRFEADACMKIRESLWEKGHLKLYLRLAMQVLKYLNVEYSSLHINIFKPNLYRTKKNISENLPRSSFLVPYSFLYILCIGCDVPLVADIHFSPSVAMRVADAFEKVRINPGNFADGIKSFENKVYNTRVMAPTLNILKLSSRNTCIDLSIC